MVFAVQIGGQLESVVVRVGMSVTEGFKVVLPDSGPLLEVCIF